MAWPDSGGGNKCVWDQLIPRRGLEDQVGPRPSACLSSRIGRSFGTRGKRRSPTKAWSIKISEHFVKLVSQWGQTVQLIVYETENGNLESLSSLAIGKQRECLGVLITSYGDEWFFAVNRFLRHKRVGRFLNPHFFSQSDGAQVTSTLSALSKKNSSKKCFSYIYEYGHPCRLSSGTDLRSHKTSDIPAPHT